MAIEWARQFRESMPDALREVDEPELVRRVDMGIRKAMRIGAENEAAERSNHEWEDAGGLSG